MDQDLELINQFKTGDLGGFEMLVKKYQNKAINIAYSLSHNSANAQDIAQVFEFTNIGHGVAAFPVTDGLIADHELVGQFHLGHIFCFAQQGDAGTYFFCVEHDCSFGLNVDTQIVGDCRVKYYQLTLEFANFKR